ncbi:MAG: hypothetical protein WBR26_18675 [Candidatus Acidiferrum sp.]
MEKVWVLAWVWVGPAFIATVPAICFNICAACIVGAGAIILTFLAATELDGTILRTKWREATVAGSVRVIGRPLLLVGSTASVKYVLRFLVGGAYPR